MVLLLALSCASRVEEPPDVPVTSRGVVTCDEPFEDGPARFHEEGVARGLDLERPSFWGGATSFDGSVAAQDLDADGDIDVLLGRPQGAPDLLLNDGTGHFSYQGRPFDDGLHIPFVATVGATDLDGDGLPEILLVGLGGILAATNLGSGHFEAPRPLFQHAGDMVPLHVSYGLGDMDGDGDLDLALPGLDWLPTDLYAAPDPSYDGRGSPVVLLESREGEFVPRDELTPDGTPGFSMYAVFADHDDDGDQDLLVSSVQLGFREQEARQALYRNDPGGWVNEGEERSIGQFISGMGGDTADLDEDGRLDHCVTDTNRIWCFVDDGAGNYYDAGIALGLLPAGMEAGWSWSAWSMDVVDFDNDGHLDAAVAAADEIHPRQLWEPWGSNFDDGDQQQDEHHNDALFWGTGAGFVDRGAEVGFDTPDQHTGLVTADFDGDGFREILLVPAVGRPELWQNTCGAGGWLEVEVRGLEGNREGIGAEVSVEAGGRRYSQLVQALRGFGQSPSRVHFGLGEVDTVDRVSVRFPDGTEIEALDVSTRQALTVTRQ